MSTKIDILEASRRLDQNNSNNIIIKNYYSLKDIGTFECLDCGNIWDTTASGPIINGNNCPRCSRKIHSELSITPEEEIIDRINLIHNHTIKMQNYYSVRNKADFQCLTCGNLWSTTVHSVLNKTGCRKCSISNKSGSKSRLWKGGISILRDFIRESTDFENWQKDSMENCNYQCIFTASKNFQIHHLYPLNKIIQDALFELGLEKYEFIGDYDEEDIRPIIDKIMEIHYRYPLGICVEKDIHKIFHKIYGKLNCTPEDFYEFCDKINSGEIQIDY